MESFTPKTKFGSYFELFHSDLNVSGINISLFNIDIYGFLLLGFVSFAEGILKSSSQTFTEIFEFLNSIVTINEIEYFIESSHVDIF